MAPKPTNTKPTGCVTTSSNCVVWQGPDIPFLKLCKGDTVSDVVYQIAERICTLNNYTNVDNYDVSCIADQCDVKTFIDLIQLVLDELCTLKTGQSTTGTVVAATSGCPDCEIPVASCFENEVGSSVAQINDYVNLIGLKVCDFYTTIQNQTNTINQMQAAILDLQSKVDALITGNG
ncbi:MAG: hypothetical protein RLY43_596 [Bacteroidota bacterium]|jgi:hypothetical protein